MHQPPPVPMPNNMSLPLPPPPPLPHEHDATGAAVADKEEGGGRERCPRCASRDTKFCYYNNYNTAQPRHFCRACRRHWTLGGSLRNVPAGGIRKRPRPRPGAVRPTRALAAAATAAVTTETMTTTTASPFAASSSPAPAPATQSPRQPFASLFGAVPLLEGRLGFGLGQRGDGEVMGPFASGGAAAPLLYWPSSMILEGDHAADTWRPAATGASLPAAAWQELAAAAPVVDAGGLHHGAPQLL